MRKIAVKLGIWMVLVSIVAAACASLPGGGDASQTELPPSSDLPQGIIAEGIIMPNQTLELSFAASGIVAEVLVEEGDFVSAGDVIARLEIPEALLTEVARAEKELLDAQQAKDKLLENAGNEAAAALPGHKDQPG